MKIQDLEESSGYSLSGSFTVEYEGALDLQDPETSYTRFMVIGRK